MAPDKCRGWAEEHAITATTRVGTLPLQVQSAWHRVGCDRFFAATRAESALRVRSADVPAGAEVSFVPCKNVESGHGAAGAYSGAWLASAALVQRVKFPNKDTLEWASHNMFFKSSQVYHARDWESFFVSHLSGFEHTSMARHDAKDAWEQIALLADAADAVCSTDDITRDDARHRTTLAVIPFYGGAISEKTGNAHSVASPEMKLKHLRGSVCAARSIAGRVIVAVSDEQAAAVADALGNISGAEVVAVPAATEPKFLPYAALRHVQSLLSEGGSLWKYVYFSESDLVLRIKDDMMREAMRAVLDDMPDDQYLVPQRAEKRFGSAAGDAHFGAQPVPSNTCPGGGQFGQDRRVIFEGGLRGAAGR